MEKIKSYLHNEWVKAVVVLIAWNVGLRFIAIVGYVMLPEKFAPLDFISHIWQSNFIFWSFANFDGEHYLSIAKFGYQIRSGFPQFAFFPLLPLLINALSHLIGDLYLSGMIVSQLSLLIAIYFIAQWCNTLKVKNIGIPLLVSTGAIFLASVYTEPVFIMLSAMAMYYSEQRWWGRAIIATAFATATRVNGIFLALFLFVKMIKNGESLQLVVSKTLLSLSGLMSYMIFLHFQVGDFLAWFHAQGAWGKAKATSPIITFISYLKAVSVDFVPDFTHLVVIFEVLVTIGAIYLFIKLLLHNQLDLAYWLYLAGNLAMPITTGSLGSMPRFTLILFPLLVVLPKLSKLGRTLYYICSITICTVGIIFFTRGYWYG